MTRPWVGSLVAPDPEPENNAEPPEQKLDLEWVYGKISYNKKTKTPKKNIFFK